MMNYHDKTKDQLIKELQKLLLECDLLKTSYSKNVSECIKMEKTLEKQNVALSKLKNFSIELSKLTLEDNLEAFIVKQLKEITGAKAALFSEYSHIERTTTVKHLEIDSRLLKKVVSLLGRDVYTIRSEVSEEMYSVMTSEIIGIRKSLSEASFGAIPRPVGAAVQSLLKADRFIGLAYIIEGSLYGTSLLVMSKGQSDPSREILENFISLAAVSLRRKKAEIALQSNEQQYRLLFDQMLNGMMVCEVICDESGVPFDHRFIQGNQAFEQLTGLSLKEQIGKTGKDFAIGWPPEVVQKLYRVAMTGESIRYERFNETLGRFYEARVFSPRKGQFAHIFTDITESKQAEDNLGQALDWQEAIFEGSLDAIFISDRNARLIAVNRAAGDLTGYSKEQLLKMTFPDLHEDNDLEAFKKYNDRIFNGEKILSEAKILRRDGIKVDTEFNNSCICISGKSYMHTTARDITARKKSERELFEFGERYQLLMENSGLGIGYYSLDGKILMFNQQAINNMGGKAGDYIGKNVTEVFGKEAGQIYIERFKLASASENPLKFEDYVNLDGKPGWYMSTHTRILDQNGNVDGIQVIADNITERKIAENSILEKNANLNAIFENTKDMIASRDKNNCLVAFNTPFKEIVRKLYNTKAVPGLNTLNFLDEKDKIKWIGILNSVLKGKTHKSEFVWDFGNGNIRTYAISYHPIIKNGEIIGTLETNRDITERKKAADKIREGYLYARSLIEASLDPLLTININGKITDVNFATEEITGIKREKLIGSDFAVYFSNPERARKVYQTVFSSGVVKDYHLTIKHSSGRKTDVLYNATLFKNAAGEIQGVLAAARDITYQKSLQSDLKRSNEILEKLNRRLDEIREDERTKISRDLHDQLGQSLTAIKMDLNMLLRYFPSGFDEVKIKINEVIDRVTTTSTDVQRISSELRPPILDDLGLSSALEWYCEEFGNRSGLNISVALEDVKTNDIKKDLTMYRVLQESLTNIVRHANAGNVWVNLYQNRNFIVLSIKDDGVGITVDRINSSKSFGLLGMSERLKQVKGRFEILSPKKGGTIIRIYMPTTQNSQ